MAHPQVADGGGGLQVLMLAANILNRQSETADKRWSLNLGGGGLDRGLITPHCKN